MTQRFDNAWQVVRGRAASLAAAGRSVIAVRDLLGRATVIVDDRTVAMDETAASAFIDDLKRQAAPFVSDQPLLRFGELFDPALFFEAPGLTEVPLAGGGRLRLLDQGVVGSEWAKVGPVALGRRRVCLYGFKGGVGRSTAAFMLAKEGARRGLGVLVVDLDLESPGVGDLLLEPEQLPPHGLLDHLVEHAVGNAEGLTLTARSTQIEGTGNGEVWVCAPRGAARDGYDYLPKLNRAYADVPTLDGRPPLPFARRLDEAVRACEREVAERSREPELVVLDSRAGLHDIAAVAISQLSDVSFLFAADSPQTWSGYRELFLQWLAANQAPPMRDRLKMVASMVPEAGQEEYLAGFRDRAQACFAELYDDEGPETPGAFNPGPDDLDAPHSPLSIGYVPGLVRLDPAARRDWHEPVESAYKDFVDGVLGGFTEVTR